MMRLPAGVQVLLLTALAWGASGQERALHRVKRQSGKNLEFPNHNQRGQSSFSGNRRRPNHNKNIDIGQIINSVIGSITDPQNQNQNINIQGAIAGLNQVLNPGNSGGIPGISEEDIINLRNSPDQTVDLGPSSSSASFPDNTVLGTFYLGNLAFSIVVFRGSLILVLEQAGNCYSGNGGCEQVCKQQGQFTRCFCNAGFELNRDLKTCSDIDYCIINNAGCSQICVNTPGSFTCACESGFTLQGDKRTCTQTGPCALNNGGCQQKCIVNDNGRAVCRCNPGYRLNQADKKTCEDIDECERNGSNGGCSDVCTNTVGSYSCSCNGDLVLNANGKKCVQPQRSCNDNNSGCQQKCIVNNNGRAVCRCNPGYRLNQGDKKTCDDVDECERNGSNGGCSDVCTNTVGSYSCSCNGDLVLNANGKKCVQPQRNCNDNNGGCQQICRTFRNGRIRCTCHQGFNLNPDQVSCSQEQNYPSCAVQNGGCEQSCRMVRERVRCYCNSGYTLDVDRISCNDVDECLVNNGGCQNHCVNNEGSFTCTCYDPSHILQSDLRQCGPPTVLCSVNNGGCEQGCIQRQDSVRCICRRGYALGYDGRTCQDLDECVNDNAGCSGRCVNTDGFFRCECNAGETLQADGKTCVRTPSPVCNNADPVSLEPLPGVCWQQNGGCQQSCQWAQGGVQCSCREGFTLQSDGRSCSDVSSCTRCGVSSEPSIYMTTKIVGGKPASPTDWPWMVALMQTHNSVQFCAGTLISNRYVLTAAHCVQHITSEGISVRVGEYDFSSNTDNSPKDMKVAEIIAHEQYDTTTQENDIAILRLENDVSFNEFVRPACLPPADNTDLAGRNAIATGWGTTSFGGSVSDVLQEVTLPIWTPAECAATYPGKVFPLMMCAGDEAGGKDSCQGDSGGPLVTQYPSSSTWHVVGVVSWGIKCAQADRPGVYTRVNQYLPWIAQKTYG